MKSIELIRFALQMSENVTQMLVADLRNAPMTPSTPGAKGGDGNHATWTLGHLCVIEGNIPWLILGEPNPVERWRPLFDMGTKVSSDASGYPSFDELLHTYHDLRAKNLRLLEEIGDETLDRAPKNIPPGFENEMRTVGRTFLTIAMHNMMHVGQIADCRRVAGLKRFL